MKANIPYSKRELRRMNEYCDKHIQESAMKCQWLMVIAINDALGIGRDRLMRVFERYQEIVDEYGGLKRDDVADEKVVRRIKQIGLPINQLYG